MNVFDYPEEVSNFTARLVHYTYYLALLAFRSYNGSKVVDLNVDGAAYAVYDSKTSDLYRVVLISYAASGSPSPFRGPWAAARLPSYTSLHRTSQIFHGPVEQQGRSTHSKIGVPEPRLCERLRCTSFWIRCHDCRVQQALACERVKYKRLPGTDSGSPRNTGNTAGTGGGSNGMPSLVISTFHSLR